MDWVYFASDSQAGPSSTIDFALVNNVICRCSRNAKGALIANVGRLRPGDRLLLVYRRPGRPHVVRLCARIATAQHPAPGTMVIQQIDGPLAADLSAAGYHPCIGGVAEVIPLEDVCSCEFQLRGKYGMGTIHALSPDDAELAQHYIGGASQELAQGIDGLGVVPADSRERSPEIDACNVASSPELREVREIRLATSTRPLFDAYVMVDWSANHAPCTGAKSIWIGYGVWHDETLVEAQENPDTRSACMDELKSRLTDFRRQGMRVLIGFDFAFGYPSGFPSALQLDEPNWQALWRFFQHEVTDDTENRHNRDEFAARCNRLIGPSGPGPFWGCPKGSAVEGILTPNRVGVFSFPYEGLEPFRLTEVRTRRVRAVPQSVWKLNQGVSVGGQSILGIKHLAGLRFESNLKDDVRVWPFETGWKLPDEVKVVLAEIFPSVLPIDQGLELDVPDRAQMRTCIRHAARLDCRGELASCFQQPHGLSNEESIRCLTEEGWILFV